MFFSIDRVVVLRVRLDADRNPRQKGSLVNITRQLVAYSLARMSPNILFLSANASHCRWQRGVGSWMILSILPWPVASFAKIWTSCATSRPRVSPKNTATSRCKIRSTYFRALLFLSLNFRRQILRGVYPRLSWLSASSSTMGTHHFRHHFGRLEYVVLFQYVSMARCLWFVHSSFFFAQCLSWDKWLYIFLWRCSSSTEDWWWGLRSFCVRKMALRLLIRLFNSIEGEKGQVASST